MDKRETPPAQVSSETLLSRLSEIDRRRLIRLGSLFTEVLHRDGRTGALIVVGGVLAKPLPRPDIDILVILGKTPKDLDPKEFPDYYQYALADFAIFKDLAEKIVASDQQLVLREVTEPYPNPEFDNPNILAHDGSIKIIGAANEGTPIELIRIAQRGSHQEILAQNRGPNIILATATLSSASELITSEHKNPL